MMRQFLHLAAGAAALPAFLTHCSGASVSEPPSAPARWVSCWRDELDRLHREVCRRDAQFRRFQKAIGADMFAVPHGFYVDREGNVWGGDQIARNGKGADLIKFAPDGKVLMILGKPGSFGLVAGHVLTFPA
jgi:hypothetical protein